MLILLNFKKKLKLRYAAHYEIRFVLFSVCMSSRHLIPLFSRRYATMDRRFYSSANPSSVENPTPKVEHRETDWVGVSICIMAFGICVVNPIADNWAKRGTSEFAQVKESESQ